MDLINAAQEVSDYLVEKEGAKLVILSGSTARGKENPNDLDISAVFKEDNNFENNKDYYNTLIKKLTNVVNIKVDLMGFNEFFISTLIKAYSENPIEICKDLNYKCQDNIKDQLQGWPLAWLFGGDAREKLKPYDCFQDQMKVLYGQEYLEELKALAKIGI